MDRALAAVPVVPAVAGLARRFLAHGCRRVRVLGLDRFLHLLEDPARRAGIVSFANHISVLDEPLMWGVMPRHLFRSARTVRWSLGASDIIFHNDLCRWFFTRGQTWETFRGQGIFQRAMNEAVAQLDAGSWVHIFPEGKVNLTNSTYLRRFKWGISRLVLEPRVTPYVVPIWLIGFDQIMPNGRGYPRWMPRTGADVCVSFGEPIPVARYADAYRTLQTHPEADMDAQLAVSAPETHVEVPSALKLSPCDNPQYAWLRSHLAAHLRAQLSLHGTRTRQELGFGHGEGTLVHTDAPSR